MGRAAPALTEARGGSAGHGLTSPGSAPWLSAAVALAVASAVALWDTRVLVVPTAGGGAWRGLLDAPGLPRLALAALAGALVALALRRERADVRRPLLWAGLALAPLLPALGGALDVLLLFQGRVLVLVAAAAATVALVRQGRVLPRQAPTRVLFAASLAVFLLVGQRLPGPAGPQGDEPHYLVQTQSLWSDGDLDLADEYAGREYAPFFAGTLEPNASPASPRPQVRSLHTPGLPLLVLPAYAALGYPGVKAFLCLLAALTAALAHRLVRETTGDEAAALAAWAVLTLTPPLPLYAVSVYPENPAALATALLLLLSRRDPGPRQGLAAGLVCALLPWLHPKLLPLAAAGLLLVVARRAGVLTRLLALAPPVLSVLGLLAFLDAVYGRPSLSAAYGPGLASDVSLTRLPWGVPALLLDRQFGLLAVSPVFALALPGAVLLGRSQRGELARAALLGSATFLVGASFSMWWGGSCPPARFVVPALPALALVLGRGLTALPSAGAALGAIGSAVLALAADAPRALHNRGDGESALLRFLAPGLDLDPAFPSFVRGGAAPVLLSLTLVAAAALFWRFRGRGLLAGGLAFGLVGAGLRTTPLVEPRGATLELLQAWDPLRLKPGPPDPSVLSLPLELPASPWTLRAGEARLSRRLELPPGAYRLEVTAEAGEAGPGSRVLGLDLLAGELRLAGDHLRVGHPPPSLDVVLPVGARRLTLAATGLQGLGTLAAARLVPLEVVPLPARAELGWPRAPAEDRYRVESAGLRVTVQDRSQPDGEGFALDGATGAFVVEVPAGAVALAVVSRPRPQPRDTLAWPGGSLRLGPLPETTVALPPGAGTLLAGTRVVPVRLVAASARVRFRAAPGPGA